jgi:hypothetical protein
MLKKYKQTGKILSVHQLKEVKGGTGLESENFSQPCEDTEDCYNACSTSGQWGNYCVNGACRRVCCP